MDKDVLLTGLLDKAVALGIVKPFDLSDRFRHIWKILLKLLKELNSKTKLSRRSSRRALKITSVNPDRAPRNLSPWKKIIFRLSIPTINKS
jgi:hypothetical protein